MLDSVPASVTGGFFDDLAGVARGTFRAVKGAAGSVAPFVHHPPGWLAAAFPLMTSENQRYWAGKLGGATGEKIYDSAVRAVASKYLGPQGPQLLEAYDKVMEDAAHGHLDAQQILARAPQIAHLATASRQGPEALRAAALATKSTPHVAIGADPLQAYRTTAVDAVVAAAHQQPAAALGYARWGLHQRVYLFPSEADGRAWLAGHPAGMDYTALFVAPDLRMPVAEVLGGDAEWQQRLSGGTVSGTMEASQVGHWFLPLALGVPAGALAGYAYRGWRERHPGEIMPGVPAVSGWPWAHIVGTDPSRRAPADWPRWQALITSATRDVLDADHGPSGGAPVYLWSLEPTGEVVVTPLASHEEGMARWRDRIQADYAALALFDRHARKHWPNPVIWSSHGDPAHEGAITAQIARPAPDYMVGALPWQSLVSGELWQSLFSGESISGEPWQSLGSVESVGYGPWYTIIGAATDAVRRAATVLAQAVRGRLIVVVRDATGNWGYASYADNAPAIERFSMLTSHPEAFAYAALFDKGHVHFPDPVEEEVGEARPGPIGRQPSIRSLQSEAA